MAEVSPCPFDEGSYDRAPIRRGPIPTGGQTVNKPYLQAPDGVVKDLATDPEGGLTSAEADRKSVV